MAAVVYLVYTGDIMTIWPLFGMSNQLLATCALIVGTTMIIAMGKLKYAWVTAVPGILMIPVTMTAGYYNIINNAKQGKYLLVVLSATLMILMAIVFFEAFKKWYKLAQAQAQREQIGLAMK